jgi:uncharacterized membrane protein YcaP (DUF421 family)
VFFDDWGGLVRVLVVGVFAYLSVLALLRISGERMLAKLNAFDFVVTVALGSTFATVLLSSDVALAEGVLAMALLIALQFLAAGRQLRVTEDEMQQAARTAGDAGPGGAAAVVLETDGSLSVLSEVPASFDPTDAGKLMGRGG